MVGELALSGEVRRVCLELLKNRFRCIGDSRRDGLTAGPGRGQGIDRSPENIDK